MMSETLEALLAQAATLRRENRIPEAEAAYERLLARHPNLPDSWYNLGLLQRRSRRFAAALESYQQALDRGVSAPEEVHLNRGVIFADDLRQEAAAERELQAALAIRPDYAPALLNLGNLHEDRGRRAEALAAYHRILAIDPTHSEALARVAGLQPISGPMDPALNRIKRALTRPGTTIQERATLAFALAKGLDSCGAWDEAFTSYVGANAISRNAAPAGTAVYDRAEQERFIDELIAAFPAPTPVTLPSAGGRASPIFICGMFRSGSTLIEQVLASHPRVTSGGELDLLPALISASLLPYPAAIAETAPEMLGALAEKYLGDLETIFPGADRLTDKRPDNFLHIGLIKRLFPDAKIIHTTRDPLDNCLSVFFLHLNQGMSYAFDLVDTAHFLRQQQRLMAHWKTLYPDDIIDFDYDAFVAQPRQRLEPLLAFLGLDWDDSLLSFHEQDSAVKTASVWQVREPLYQSASGRWRNYERHLGPLRAFLDGSEE